MLNQTTPAGSLGPHPGSLGPHRGPTWPKYWNVCGFGRFRAALAVLWGLRPNQRMQPTGRMGAGRRSGGALRWSR